MESPSSCWAAIPEGNSYSVVIADPCWLYVNSNVNGCPKYKCLSLGELSQLPVRTLAKENAVLLMWCTGPKLPEAFPLAKAWGFPDFKTVLFCWNKTDSKGQPHLGLGCYSRSSLEYVLMFTRGKGHTGWVSSHSERQLISETRLGHSIKPESIREKLCKFLQPTDKKRIELFARTIPDPSYECDAHGLELPGVFHAHRAEN